MLLNACQHFNETKNSYVQTNSTTFTKNTSEKQSLKNSGKEFNNSKSTNINQLPNNVGNNEDLYSAKSDGSGVGKIIEGAYGYGMFVDEINDKIYYEDRNKPAIMRANLDGSGIVKIADAPGTRVHGMAIDYSSNKFYWADRDKSVIRRANLDGTGAETFLSGLSSPRGIFIKNKE